MRFFITCLLLCASCFCPAAKRTLILTHEVKAPVEIAYSYFIDFEKFGSIHPAIKETKRIKEPAGNSMGIYSIKEAVLLYGFIPLHPKYTAEVFEVEKGNKILYTSRVKKSVYLEINFLFSKSETGSTIIREEVILTGNGLICSLLRGQMKKAHLKLVENLKKEVQKAS
jgi:hypothetical protein